MEHSPLISIIINCFNGERFLREAIDSVIAQTYSNWELIFWDNQSTDSTANIVRSYHDDRIRYFYAPEHTSLGEARNLALEKANGVYIGFLDSDDKWLPSFLSEYVSVIRENPSAVLIYSNYYCCENSKMWIAYKNKCPGEINVCDLLSRYDVAISSALFKSDIVKIQNIRFNANFSLIEDYDFFIRLGVCGKILYVSSPLMIYLYHQNNLSHSSKWVDEFRYLLSKINKESLAYSELIKYRNVICKRAYYVEANYYVFSGQRRKALCIIFKYIFRYPIFIVLLLKIICGPNNLRKLHIIKQKV